MAAVAVAVTAQASPEKLGVMAKMLPSPLEALLDLAVVVVALERRPLAAVAVCTVVALVVAGTLEREQPVAKVLSSYNIHQPPARPTPLMRGLLQRRAAAPL